MICPNVTRDSTLVLGRNYMDPAYFRLVIATCINSTDKTGKTDCYDYEKTLTNIADIAVYNYFVEELPSPWKVIPNT